MLENTLQKKCMKWIAYHQFLHTFNAVQNINFKIKPETNVKLFTIEQTWTKFLFTVYQNKLK